MLDLCRWLSWITWGIFAIDLVVRLSLADDRLRYLARHWYDVLVIALPLLRPLRLLRLIPLIAVLNRRAQTKLRGRVAIYVAGGASLLAFCAALAVLDAERSSPNANITDFGDAIWWAVTTMTTVGYGDRYPVTGVGRLAAFGLMVGGIALLGTVTATLASWLVEAVAAEKEQAEDLQVRVRRLGGQGRSTGRQRGPHAPGAGPSRQLEPRLHTRASPGFTVRRAIGRLVPAQPCRAAKRVPPAAASPLVSARLRRLDIQIRGRDTEFSKPLQPRKAQASEMGTRWIPRGTPTTRARRRPVIQRRVARAQHRASDC